MTQIRFEALGLSEVLLAALSKLEIVTPTPIQAKAIPSVLKGRDVLGIAQTGTGKTAAFSLPVIDALMKAGDRASAKHCRALFLAPTRELALQIAENVKAYSAGTPIRHMVVFGGVSIRPQIETARRGVDIVIATPGRLLDMIDQKALSLSEVRHVVLDEADRMLDMGFVRDVMRIVKLLPAKRQSLLFSATMPNNVETLAARILSDPVRVEVTPEVVTVEKINQSIYLVPQKAKKHWLIQELPNYEKTVVFTRTKHGANRLTTDLEKAGIQALAIHGNKSQAARQKALSEFHAGKLKVLIATDIVARGIHVDDISHVINFDLPEEAESYVHRIGRTARAGKSGIAITLCDPSERTKLRSVEKLTGLRFDVQKTSFSDSAVLATLPEESNQRGPRPQRGRAGQPTGDRKPPRGGKPGERRGKAQGKPGGENRSAKPAGNRWKQGGNRGASA
ncbi:DEAD/DEAH box helicase [Aureimonas fodinaquatilis]|uniref:DEAD/DEAH box helicase n=1 Tax=Aureimonas fodinaquatilis TaxID=2565783 RepID=A0A5B0E2G7_9HYPH|nr:DEAD/DEAH box helicase [Aureimonas fodinaquatilis]KAA0972315.1 DEAD/DEAH box helicase [Aureimonas fodinaquatilis]